MEWREIENKVTEALREKEITPSAEAWTKLSGQLEQHDKKISKQKYKKVFYLAACLLLGGYFVSLFIFKQENVLMPNTIENTLNSVVGVDTIKVKEQKQEAEQRDFIDDYKPTVLKERNRKVEQLEKALVKEDKEKHAVPLIEVPMEEFKENLLFTETLSPIATEKSTKRVVVNSNDLLKQVEGEIVVEYRESVVKKIYEKTKKVVVDISNSKDEK